MAFGNNFAAWLFKGILSPFSGHNAMLSLIPFSVLFGIGMLLVFRATSNREAIGRAKARLQAHLYEMRLFTDEPSLIWKAQWGLLRANARYIGWMLVPALVMSGPMVVVIAQMECFYGLAPIEAGRDAIVTVQMKAGEHRPAPALRASDGIAVESPSISVDGGRQFSWRIRALGSGSGTLQVIFPEQVIRKSIETGTGPRYISERRVSSALDSIWYPAESRLPAGFVDWVEIRYPKPTIHALGLDLNWLIWLLIMSMISALFLKRRFGVIF